LGAGLSIVLISTFLNSFFAFHSGVGIVPIGLGLLILLLVIAATVSSQIWKIQKANPAAILKSE